MTEQERQNLLDRIAVDPAIQGGRPVIKGTRMPVSRVLGALSAGATSEELQADYSLQPDDVRAALAYAADLLDVPTLDLPTDLHSDSHSYIEHLLDTYLDGILKTQSVAVPDDAEEMNWRIFFAHSQDMQGFGADVFTGGPHERPHPSMPYRGLRVRWEEAGGTSSSLIADLAALWDDSSMRQELQRLANPFKPAEEKRQGIEPALNLMRRSGAHGAVVFAEALDDLRGNKIARKTNMMICAYVRNAHLLRTYHDCSFRSYLYSQLGSDSFPTADATALESRWVSAILHDFYNVGPSLAPYMICDWLMGYWLTGAIEWFASYKLDSVHEDAAKAGVLPASAVNDFVGYCRSIRIPARFPIVGGKPCPPRILNECIWLDRNQSSGTNKGWS